MSWAWAYICGIDWAALGQTARIFSVPLLLYISYRNDAVADIHIDWIREEHAWLDEHLAYAEERPWRRVAALPSQRTMVWKFWIPLKDYKAAVLPVAEYYKEIK
jgi:hypothetical protein